MEPLTTQTFSGDETQAPLPRPGSEAATPDGTSAGPFRDFGISEANCSGLEAAGIFTTFPIQALTVPFALRGKAAMGQARPGPGKTLAFGLPLLRLVEAEREEKDRGRAPRAL